MKNKIKYILTFIFLFIVSINVNAILISSEKLGNTIESVNEDAQYAYIIGEYVFTDSTQINTRDIMLAARSIKVTDADGKTNEDDIYSEMRILYAEWVEYSGDDSIWKVENYIGTGDIPTSYDIKYVDYKEVEEATTNLYTVSFSDESSYSSQTIEEGSLAEEPTKPEKEGYKFEGWYTEDDVLFDFNTKITGNVDLYAKWTKVTCKVTFEGMDNTDEFKELTLNCGESITTLAEPTSTDRGEFVNWYAGGVVFDITTAINDDILLTAKFEKDFIYTVTFYDGQEELKSLMQEVKEGELATKPEDPTKEGYTFIDWFNSKGNIFDFTTKIMSDLELNAGWEVTTYSVKFYNLDEELTDLSTTVNYGGTVTEPSMEDEVTARFKGWYTSTEFDTKYDFSQPVKSNLELYALYVPFVANVASEEDFKAALTSDSIEVIQLADDVTLTEPLSINRNIEIYGAGKTLKADYTSENGTFITINGGLEVTMENVIIDANGKGRGIKVSDSKLTFKDSTVKNGKSTSYVGGIFITEEGNLEFINSTLVDNENASEYSGENYINYSKDLWIGAEATATITSGTIGNMFVNGNEYGSSSVTINGGTISNVYLEYDKGNGATVTYNDGTISNILKATESNGVYTPITNPEKGTYTSVK